MKFQSFPVGVHLRQAGAPGENPCHRPNARAVQVPDFGCLRGPDGMNRPDLVPALAFLEQGVPQ